MQLYLPDELYEAVKARGLPASELFQRAVRAEIRRLDLLKKTDEYVSGLIKEVGMPTAAERKRAAATAERLDLPAKRRAG
jgi:post-segregation antitoxin (ccd killing protein)